MELIKALEQYTSTQKRVGTGFIIIAIFLFSIFLISQYISTQTPLIKGLEAGTLVCSLFILIGGIGYRIFSVKKAKRQKEIYKQFKKEFIEKENQRMRKVIQNYPIYQIIFSIFIAIATLVILFAKNSFFKGIAFAIIFLFINVLIVELFSYQSIQNYKSILENNLTTPPSI